MNEDWRYSDDRMKLRQQSLYALKHHLNDACRYVFEFCNLWVSQGNKDVVGIEESFQEYCLLSLNNSYEMNSHPESDQEPFPESVQEPFPESVQESVVQEPNPESVNYQHEQG
tara:strand:- start:487 stop:825 length:339 start_codon:yes stop_codon:yes gene_type:complete